MINQRETEVRSMQTAIDIKQAAHQLIDQLPTDATWDAVVYRLVERREIELGLADSDAGRTTAVEDVMKEFGITP
jgi:predicted transcriptional regulator